MDGGEHPGLVASWKAERRWFRWTVGFTAGLCVWLAGIVVLRLWFSNALNSLMGSAGGRRTLDDLQAILESIEPFRIALNLLMVIASLGFIISLIKWLLAIRKRRRVQVSVGFQPGEHR